MGARVLLVEDDAGNRETLEVMLVQMGHEPVVAECGEDALRVLETADTVDLIISDVVMPGISGVDFAKRARALRPATPIVLVTGDANAVESVLQSGAIALLKPYSAHTLKQIVREALEST